MAGRPEKLAALGYTEAWARAGIVDDALLDAQFEEWQRTAEPTEHLRWRAIEAFLARGERVGLGDWLEITRADLRVQSPDPSLARAVARGAQRAALGSATCGDAPVQAALLGGDRVRRLADPCSHPSPRRGANPRGNILSIPAVGVGRGPL